MLYKWKREDKMKITNFKNDYSTQRQNKKKNNSQAFGEFLIVTIPKEQIKAVSGSWCRDIFGIKYRQELEARMEEIVKSVRALAKKRIKIYCRDLSTIRLSSGYGVKNYDLDLSPLQISSRLSGDYDKCARTLYLDDEGKNRPLLSAVYGRLSEWNLHPKVCQRDLFADKAHSYDGILEGTNLQQYAWGATPEDMIKL